MGSRLSAYRLPLLTGFLLGTGYIPFPPWSIPFCFAPLWLFWVREGSLRKALWGGWLAQFLFALIGFHWLAGTAHEFGRLSWPFAVLALLLFSAFGHLYFVLAGLAFSLLRKRFDLSRTAQLALLPCLTALCARYVPMVFPWNLGYPWLWAGLPALQVAEYVGFEGLGVLTLFLNLVLLLAWERRKDRGGARLFGAAVIFAFLVNGVGWIAGKGQPPPDGTARILVVQGNVGSLEKASAGNREDVRTKILLRYFRLTLQGLAASGGRAPDFAVWPESAFPETLLPRPSHMGNAGALRSFLRSYSTALVTGALRFDEAGGRKSNSMFFFDRDGGAADRPYDKTRLLAFGEFVPFSDAFPGLRRWFPWTAEFARGPGPETRRVGALRLGPQICYEGLFPDASRSLAGQGAQIFVNLTNDSWFGTRAEPYQHLIMTMARGIEFRRPVVRATNTGISAAMLPDGTFLERSPLHAEWTHLYEIPYRKEPSPTFYQEYGFRIVPAFLWLAAAAALAAGRRRNPVKAP